MKKTNIFLLLLILSIAVISACKKNEDSDIPSASVTKDLISQGTWKVTYFNDSGDDETYHFSGYVFSFNSGGSVSAVKNSSTMNGTWSTGTDDSQEKLNLDFGQTMPFDELNDDWHILENSESKIRLEDVSGGSGETDYLTFELN